MQFDLVVIGSGPAGHKAALQAAKAGKQVAMVVGDLGLGGGCVHTGTLPSKSLRESVYRYSLGSRGMLGQEIDSWEKPERKRAIPDYHRLLNRRNRVISVEMQVIQDQLTRNNVMIIPGMASFVTETELEVNYQGTRRLIRGDKIIIAVGARPIAPSHLKVDSKRVFDSDTIFKMEKVPKTMVVLGGGIIGCEYASMFSMAGTRVFLVDKRHEILASVDREIVNHLMDRFHYHGMEIILETEVKKLKKQKAGVEVELSNGRSIKTDAVLVALGRTGNIEKLQLKNAGIEPNQRGLIEVNENYETSTPGIYAVGDVIGFPALASTSMEQGRLACCHAFGICSTTSAQISELYPYGIYTIPEISMIGPTEEQLTKDGVQFVSGRAHYREIARGQIVGDRWGLLKLLVDKKTLKVLGVHIIGDSAAEIIHIGQAVMAHGADVRYFIQNVFNYPTLAEAYKTAAFHAVNQIGNKTETR